MSTDTSLPHSVFHIFSCDFILNILPANYYFMHHIWMCPCLSERWRKKVGVSRWRNAEWEEGNSKEGISSEEEDETKNLLSRIAVYWQVVKLNEKSMPTSHVSGQSFFFLVCRVKRQLLFTIICVWWSDWQNTRPEVGEMKEEMKGSHSEREVGECFPFGQIGHVKPNQWTRYVLAGSRWPNRLVGMQSTPLQLDALLFFRNHRPPIAVVLITRQFHVARLIPGCHNRP